MVLVDPSFSLQDCIAIMKDMLSKDWIRNFLLHQSTVDDLGILTSKDHRHHARVGHMKCGAPMGATVTNVYRANWLFIPAFYHDGYSAFIFMQELDSTIRAKDNSRLWNSRDTEKFMKSSNGKFMRGMRHEATDTLMIFDTPQAGNASVEVEVMIAVVDREIRTRQRAYFRVEKNLLDTGQFETIKTSVHMLIQLTEHLACPVCKLPTSTNSINSDDDECFCVLPNLKPPQHSLDLRTSSGNFAAMIGTYTGLYSAVNPMAATRDKVRDQRFVIGGVYGGNKAGTFARIHSWGISHSLAKYFCGASPQNMPFQNELIAKAHETIASYFSTASTSKSPCAFNTNSNNFYYPVTNFLRIGHTPPGFSSLPLNIGAIPSPNGVVPAVSCGTSPAAWGRCQSTAARNNNNGNSQGFKADAMEDIERLLGTSTNIIPYTTTNNNININTTSSLWHPSAPPPMILPNNSTDKSESNSKSTAKNDNELVEPHPDDNSLDAKELRRKLRNRKSAACSNLKKRLEIAKLQKDIVEYKQRKKTQGARLEELKIENALLSAQLRADRLN